MLRGSRFSFQALMPFFRLCLRWKWPARYYAAYFATFFQLLPPSRRLFTPPRSRQSSSFLCVMVMAAHAAAFVAASSVSLDAMLLRQDEQARVMRRSFAFMRCLQRLFAPRAARCYAAAPSRDVAASTGAAWLELLARIVD